MSAQTVLVLGAIVAIMALTLAASTFIGPRSSSRRRDLPYESGIAPTLQAPWRFPVHFYLIALAFLLFDIEAAFLFAWAIAARQTGWLGYAEALVFSIVLFAGLIYLWAKGAFEWGVESD